MYEIGSHMNARRFSFLVIFAVLVIVGFTEKQSLLYAVGRFISWNRCAPIDVVRAENNALREQILMSKATAAVPPKTIRADVYASYPFNNQNVMLIAAGSDEGVRVMMPATIGGAVLVGQVVQVFKHSSVVRTIVSPDWQIPVRVGSHKAPGLLMGGPTVRVSMIPATLTIAVGDAIIVASKDMPYGVRVGTVSRVAATTVGGVFQEAVVKLGYDLYTLTELTIMLWTPD